MASVSELACPALWVKGVSVETPQIPDAHLLEFGVVVGEIAELGGAYDCEIRRVKHQDRPAAVQVGVSQGHEFASVEGGRLEAFNDVLIRGLVIPATRLKHAENGRRR